MELQLARAVGSKNSNEMLINGDGADLTRLLRES